MARKKASSEDGFSIEDFGTEEFKSAKDRVDEQSTYRVYSTGFLMLDCAIGEVDPIKGNAGVPERTIVENFGRNQTLKSAIYEQLAKNILEEDKDNHVVIIYAEEPDMDRWYSIGITEEMMQNRIHTLGCFEGDELLLHTAEKQLDRAKLVAQDSRVKLVVIDSIKGLCSSKQLYSKNGQISSLENQEQMALRATLIGEFIRDFKQLNKRAILWFTNQTSDNIMLGPGSLIINPQFTIHTPGGRAKEFEAHLRILNETRPIYAEEEHELYTKKPLIGWELSSRVIKNKFVGVGKHGNRVAVGNFYFDIPGFDRAESVLILGEYLTRKGYIEENSGLKKGGGGAWKVMGEGVRGEEAVLEYLRKQDKIREQLENLIVLNRNHIFAPPSRSIALAREL
jgi:RecA/RadA recombinase